MYLMILSKKLMEVQLKFLICMVAKRDLIGDILELKLEYVEKTYVSIDFSVDGDGDVLIDEAGRDLDIFSPFAHIYSSQDSLARTSDSSRPDGEIGIERAS